MSKRAKVIFLSLSIFGSFLIYCVYYCSNMIKDAPFRSYELESVVFRYGEEGNLVNQFDSKTAIYPYLNNSDSLVSTKVKFNKNDFVYLHHKTASLGFWDFTQHMTESNNPDDSNKSTQFLLEFNYKE